MMLAAAALIAFGGFSLYAAKLPPWENGIPWSKPRKVDPGPPGGPPSDAIVLFGGKDLAAWTGVEKWEVKDGYAVCKSTAQTKQPFGDCQVHVEWLEPAEVSGEGQKRGNSGIFLMGFYEVQVLDSLDNETYYDGQAGAIYKQHPPLVNACRKQGEWQNYDIIFRGPRFDKDGKLLRPAFVTVLHNGVLVQDHFELLGRSNYRVPPFYGPHPEKLPLTIQYHGSPVHYRNMWIRELPDPDDQLLVPLRAKLRAAAATKPS
jgi:hypothetical protein